MDEYIRVQDLGFSVVVKKEKFTLLKNDRAALWLRRGDENFALGRIDDALHIATKLAARVNDSWVAVNVLETTSNGGARVSFKAIHKARHPEQGEQTETKRAQVWVPAAAIETIGEVSCVSPSMLNKKLAEMRAMAHSKWDREKKWEAVHGGVTTPERLREWIEPMLRARRERNEAQRTAARAAKALEYNQDVNQAFNKKLLSAYWAAATAFAKRAAGKRAGLGELQDIKLVKAAIAVDGFKEFRIQWLAREVARVERPKPVKVREPLEVIENCTVKWVKWSTVGGKFQRADYEQAGCTARRFSARKWTITLPDGDIVEKLAGPNLVIEPEQRTIQSC